MMMLRVLFAGALLGASTVALAAAPTTNQQLAVEHAWIRWMPANLPEAGYAVLVNNTGAPISLVGASSTAYKMVTPMESRSANGADTMKAVNAIPVPAHGTTKIAPGGYHLMLMHATKPLKPGDKVPITLQFSGGQSLEVVFSVLPADATGPAD